MNKLVGFIIFLSTMKRLQGSGVQANCSNYYLIIEETQFGLEPVFMKNIDVGLLDPSIPRHCYLGLYCEEIVSNCQDHVHYTPNVGTHTVIWDPSRVITTKSPIVVKTEAPIIPTTKKVFDTAKVNITPTETNIPTPTVTDATKVSSTDMSREFTSTLPTADITTKVINAPIDNITETSEITTTDAVIELSTPTQTETSTANSTEVTEVSITNNETDKPLVNIYSPKSIDPTINVTENSVLFNTSTVIATKTSNSTPVTKTPESIDPTINVTENSKLFNTSTVIDTKTFNRTTVTKPPIYKIADEPKASTTTVKYTPLEDITSIETRDPTATVPDDPGAPNETIVTDTTTEKITHAVTKAPTNFTDITKVTTTINPIKSNDESAIKSKDRYDNKYINQQTDTDSDFSYSMKERLLAVIKNSSEVDIILMIVLIFLGLISFNILCYLALRKVDTVRKSGHYDVAKYE